MQKPTHQQTKPPSLRRTPRQLPARSADGRARLSSWPVKIIGSASFMGRGNADDAWIAKTRGATSDPHRAAQESGALGPAAATSPRHFHVVAKIRFWQYCAPMPDQLPSSFRPAHYVTGTTKQ